MVLHNPRKRGACLTISPSETGRFIRKAGHPARQTVHRPIRRTCFPNVPPPRIKRTGGGQSISYYSINPSFCQECEVNSRPRVARRSPRARGLTRRGAAFAAPPRHRGGSACTAGRRRLRPPPTCRGASFYLHLRAADKKRLSGVTIHIVSVRTLARARERLLVTEPVVVRIPSPAHACARETRTRIPLLIISACRFHVHARTCDPDCYELPARRLSALCTVSGAVARDGKMPVKFLRGRGTFFKRCPARAARPPCAPFSVSTRQTNLQFGNNFSARNP